MRQIKAIGFDPQYGRHTVYCRVDGKLVFLKVQQNTAIKKQMIENFRQKGASVLESRTGWARVNIFAAGNPAKVGDQIIDIEEEPKEHVEIKLFTFLVNKYREAKYKVEVSQV